MAMRARIVLNERVLLLIEESCEMSNKLKRYKHIRNSRLNFFPIKNSDFKYLSNLDSISVHSLDHKLGNKIHGEIVVILILF